MASRSLTDESEKTDLGDGVEVRVRRLHRRDLNRTWEFLKLVFRDVNRETVEYQRPRTKNRFIDVYDDDDTEQLLFEVEGQIVGYAECTFEIGGSDNWLNPRYFERRDMRPLFVEELAVHPDFQGRGVGGFMLDQLQHLARLRGCTHLMLEVAENNRPALAFYRRRGFQKLDAAIFMAQKVGGLQPELLPPRVLARKSHKHAEEDDDVGDLRSAELPDEREGDSEPPARGRAAAALKKSRKRAHKARSKRNDDRE